MKKVLIAAIMLLSGSLYAQVATNYEVGTWYQFKTAAVSYTMDDNCSNQLPVALPLFDKYNFKVTFFTVVNWGPSWSGLLNASKNGHEVGSHTMTHPTSLTTLSITAQNTELQQSQTTINSNITNAKCLTLAYPNCNRSDLATTQKYYIAARVCSGTVEGQTPADFYNISSIITGNTGSVQTAANFNSKVASAKTSKGWCVFLTHGIDGDGGYSPTQSSELASHLAYMNTNSADFWVSPFGTVVKYIKERNTASVAETVITSDSLKVVVANNLDNTIYNVPITIRRLLPTGWQNPKVYLNTTLIASSLSTVNGKTYIVFDAIPNQGNIFLANKSTVVTPAAPTVTTPVTYCQNASATALTATGAALKWYSNNTITTALSAAPVPVTSATGTVNYYVSQTVNGVESSRAVIAVTVNTLPAATIAAAGTTTFCAGGNVVLNANTGTGLTYKWNNAAGVISGATSASYTAIATGSYTVTVSNASCSATSAATTVTVNTLPTATITAAGATAFCAGSNVVLNANTGTGLTYKWNNAAGVISGATSTSYTATTSGSYTVTVSNTNCSATSTATAVTVNTLPTATITAAGATTFCAGGNVVLNANTGTGLTYKWNNAAGVIAGATSASYTATTADSYKVTVSNANCSATSTATAVTVNALPTATITAAGGTTFCAGGNVVLNANTGSGLTYKWNNAAGVIAGATSASYTATTADSYKVTVSNANCSATSAATIVTVNALPTATITAAGATTFCAGGNVVLNANTGSGLTYKWNNAAGVILGATSSSYTATAADSYKVTVSNTNCSATSAPITVTISAAPVWYLDADGDGKGDASTAQTSCTKPAGAYVSVAGDACPTDASKLAPGDCGCGNQETDTDGDTTPDCIDPDDDNDGIADANDCQPLNASVTGATVWYLDADGDGKGDASTTQTSCTKPAGAYVSVAGDACPADANKLTPGACGCGNLETDTDGDTTPDCIDTDDDNDGIADANDCQPLNASVTGATVWYLDADGDGKGDASTAQTSCTKPTGAYVSIAGDACPEDPNKLASGACGCGNLETDTDGDTTPDCIDTDDDNDGVADANDCASLDTKVGAATIWYQDADGDGEGDPSSTLNACAEPTGYVSIAGDGCPADANKTSPGVCGCGKIEGSCVATGIQTGLSTALQIYPNPSETDFTIVAGSGYFTVTFYNASGLEVFRGEYDSEAHVGSDLKQGIYLIRIEQQGTTETRKIIKK